MACFSGGGSALLVQPAEGLTLQDLQETGELLLASGADITLMNTVRKSQCSYPRPYSCMECCVVELDALHHQVRKHLSAVKGGQLALAAAPATVVSLVLSDVIGDPCPGPPGAFKRP